MEIKKITLFIEERPIKIEISETEEEDSKIDVDGDGDTNCHYLEISKYSDQEGRNIVLTRFIDNIVVDAVLVKFPEYYRENKTLVDYLTDKELITFKERIRWELIAKFIEDGLIVV